MAANRRELERKAAAVLELRRRKSERRTVIGFVSPEKGLTHCITQKPDGEWVETDKAPDVYLAAKMEKVVTSTKRFIVLVGGRGSTKSIGVGDLCLADAKDNGAKTYCLREFQASIKNSVYSLLKDEIRRLEFDNFEIQNTTILKDGSEVFEFSGIARNIDNIKSSHGFKRFFIEEAQFLSQESLDELTPTARKKPKKGLPGEATEEDLLDNVSMIFVANPGSQKDPFSQRFLVPFQTHLDRHGYYEDDLHLIIVMNYTDNPWFLDSGLEGERQWDFENRSRAYYDHRWLGKYNDSVEDAIIMSEWFDAVIDAHIKLGFSPSGARTVSHDPSDLGPDPKGLVDRYGSVVMNVLEKTTGDIDEGARWALDYAIEVRADSFIWDGDGMGVGIRKTVSDHLTGKKITPHMFRGSEGVDRPTEQYMPPDKGKLKIEGKTNRDTFYNKRAQYYWYLRDRFYNTYLAVIHGRYFDPDDLISLSSDIECLDQLRSELCRIPKKPNGAGKIQIMSKEEMAKPPLRLDSPNLADSLMMSEDRPQLASSENFDINFASLW